MSDSILYDKTKYLLEHFARFRFEYEHFGGFYLLDDKIEKEQQKILLDAIENALEMIKTYPRKGEKYYTILYSRYFDLEHSRKSFKKLAEQYGCSIAQIARLEKEAIVLIQKSVYGGV